MSLTLTLNNVALNITRYGAPSIFVLGIVGSLVNILLLSRQPFRTISCCAYFLAASCASLISLSFGLIPTFYIYQNTYLTNYSFVFCKMQGYFTHVNLQITRMFLVVACFDGYALSSSNVNIRKFSQVSVARRVIPIIIITCYIIAIHLVIYLDLERGACGIRNTSALIYNSIYSITSISIIIPTLMFIFSILTFCNLKKRQPFHQQIRRDQKTLFILMMQLILYFISTVLYAPNIIYITITQNILNKSFDRQIIESFINGLAVSLIYIYPGFSFFVFTLSSKTFRKELFKFFRLLLFNCCTKTNRIIPIAIFI